MMCTICRPPQKHIVRFRVFFISWIAVILCFLVVMVTQNRQIAV